MGFFKGREGKEKREGKVERKKTVEYSLVQYSLRKGWYTSN